MRRCHGGARRTSNNWSESHSHLRLESSIRNTAQVVSSWGGPFPTETDIKVALWPGLPRFRMSCTVV